MKVVVIGAGPTGLGAAYRLYELKQCNNNAASTTEILLLEQESFPGGLSRTEVDDKGFLWDMGVHITYTFNSHYYESAVKWGLDGWNDFRRNCQVDLAYLFNEERIHLLPYPAQFAVPLFPEKYKKNALRELKERYDKVKDGVPKNFDEWIIENLGPTIRNCFFRPYIRKLWRVETEEMNSTWVGLRVAMLPQAKLEELCAMNPEELANADFGWGPHSKFSFPKTDGTGSIWKGMADKFPQSWFRYNCKVTNVDAYRKKVTCIEKTKNGERRIDFDYDILVNTSPLDMFIKNTQLCSELNIQHTKVVIVGVGLKQPVTGFLEGLTWIYFPDPEVPFYRVTVPSGYGDCTPDISKYWALLCECGADSDDTRTEEEIRDAAVEGLIKKTMITREQIVTVYSTTLPYGYPIPTIVRDGELARAHKILEEHSIYSRGRFGGWKYEVSNQDHCFMQGKELIDRILLDKPEEMYETGLPTKQR